MPSRKVDPDALRLLPGLDPLLPDPPGFTGPATWMPGAGWVE